MLFELALEILRSFPKKLDVDPSILAVNQF